MALDAWKLSGRAVVPISLPCAHMHGMAALATSGHLDADRGGRHAEPTQQRRDVAAPDTRPGPDNAHGTAARQLARVLTASLASVLSISAIHDRRQPSRIVTSSPRENRILKTLEAIHACISLCNCLPFPISTRIPILESSRLFCVVTE